MALIVNTTWEFNAIFISIYLMFRFTFRVGLLERGVKVWVATLFHKLDKIENPKSRFGITSRTERLTK